MTLRRDLLTCLRSPGFLALPLPYVPATPAPVAPVSPAGAALRRRMRAVCAGGTRRATTVLSAGDAVRSGVTVKFSMEK